VCFVLTYHVLLIDVPSLVYASLVALLPENPSWPLWFAKYHGFSVNLALSYLLLAVLKNLKKFVRQKFGCIRYVKTLEYNNGWPAFTLNKSHAHYSYRVLVSGFVHTIVHAVFTHPFKLLYDPRYSLPIKVNDLLYNKRPEFAEIGLTNQTLVIVRSFFADSYTWTGYFLLTLIAIPILITGLRLARYARLHFLTLTAHRSFAWLIIPLVVHHHSIYIWPVIWTLMYALDFILGVCAYTESCVIVKALRYPNHQLENPEQTNDVVDLTFTYPYKNIEDFQPGDYVRVKIPQISRFEWHDFTLMKSAETATIVDCTAHITIRSVGKWTRSAYLLAEGNGTIMLVKGPYSLHLYDPLMNRILQSGESRFLRSSQMYDEEMEEQRCCRPIRVQMPRVLILACTGTAITHIMSILDSLIPMYYSGFNETELPRKVIVCWTVRTIFNLNFALLPLSRYQRQLSIIQLENLLHYEFFVTEQPTNNDVISAQMFRRMLIRHDEGNSSSSSNSSSHATACSLFVRNSRLSMMDIISGADGRRNINTSMGTRPNYDALAKRHIFGEQPEHVLIILNSSVKAIQKEFEKMANKYKCRLSCDNIF
jgi:hypothetical protein